MRRVLWWILTPVCVLIGFAGAWGIGYTFAFFLSLATLGTEYKPSHATGAYCLENWVVVLALLTGALGAAMLGGLCGGALAAEMQRLPGILLRVAGVAMAMATVTSLGWYPFCLLLRSVVNWYYGGAILLICLVSVAATWRFSAGGLHRSPH